MNTLKYDGYHEPHNCSSINNISKIDIRLQELEDAGFDCSIIKSIVVQQKEIPIGLLLDRDEVLEIMGNCHSPNISKTIVHQV
jgi:hypothetical protein